MASSTGGKNKGSSVSCLSTATWVEISCTYLRIPNDIQQRDDVRSTSNVLQNLDLSLNLLLLDGLEHFDDAL